MKVSNKYVFHEYEIIDRCEAGIKLTGPEVKSIKASQISLKGAFVRFIGSELFLVNATIPKYQFATLTSYDPQRSRKLLVKKSQIIAWQTKLAGAPLTLVPISVYTKHGLIKVEVGLARGRKQYEKREVLKRRAEKRELERGFRGKIK